MKLFEILKKYAACGSDCTAFVDGIQSVTYRDLWQLIQVNRCYLIEKGFQNQVVIYKVGTQLKFAIDFLCLMSAGCWVVPITPDVSANTYKKLMSVHGIAHEIDSYFLSDHWVCWQNELFDQNEDNCGIYHLTSGSTDEPKICIRSLRALNEEGATYKKHFSMQNVNIVSLAPVYHSFALGAAYMTALQSGSSVYLVDKFVPRRAVDIIGTWRANIVIAVPVMIKAITNVSLLKQYDFSSLSVVLVGTGVVPMETGDAFKERFGVFISSNYGSTETGGLIMRLAANPADSIGKEMYGVEAKLVCQENDLIADSMEGELYVKCNYMMDRYLNDEQQVLDKDGFFPMGDIVKKDEQGFYYVKGRIKKFINIGGKKVNPKEVEDTLLRFPGIRDCMVCRAMRTKDQEIVKAVIAGEDLDATSIRKYLRNELADYKIPSVIDIVKNINRNEIGKIVNRGKE